MNRVRPQIFLTGLWVILLVGCRTATPKAGYGRESDAATVTPAAIQEIRDHLNVDQKSLQGTLALSLEKCLELALGNSAEIELGRLQPLIRGEDIFIASEVFTPRISIEAREADLEAQTANSQIGADVLIEEERVVEGSISKKWGPGTRTDLRWIYERRADNSEFRTLNPAFESTFSIDIEQPLLNGFGLAVNRAELDKAILGKRIADLNFEMLLEAELLSTVRDYWGLVLAAMELETQMASLALASESTSIARDRVESGIDAAIELTWARAVEAEAAESALEAEGRYRRASDRLLIRIRPGAAMEAFNLRIIPTSRPETAGHVEDEILNPRSLAEDALDQRAELVIERMNMDVAEIELAVASQRRLPSLDLIGRYGANGLAASSSQSREDMISGDFPAWMIGARLEFLFLNKSRAARYRQTVLEQAAAIERYEQLATSIIGDVRFAILEVHAASQRVEAAKQKRSYAQERVAELGDRVATGLATTFDLQSSALELLSAEQNLVRAESEQYIARILLAAARGIYAKQLIRQLRVRADVTIESE